MLEDKVEEFRGTQRYKDVVFQERLKKREIWINGNINEDLVEKLYVNLLEFDEQKSNEKIWVMINSYGGQFYEALVATDIMRTINSPIVTVAMAKAVSGGFVIFMGGDLRIVHENTMLMMHPSSFSCFDKTPAIKNRVDYSCKTHDKMAKFLANQTAGKTTVKYWLDLLQNEKDVFFTAEEALKLGITHRIIGKSNDLTERYIWKV